MSVSVGVLILRLVVGGLFMGHGAQKLFGFFHGAGLQGTAEFFEGVGLKPGWPMAVCAGMAELGGGILLGMGLLTPLAAALLIGVMATAVLTVHMPHGLWAADGGFEYNLALAAVAFTVCLTGSGSYSLDHVLNIQASGGRWALGALAAALIGALATMIVSGRDHKAHTYTAQGAV